jgi:hypothetical protein
MDRDTLQEHLRQAMAHVAQGREHIVSQQALIAELERDGHDTAAAKQLLEMFEQSQAMHAAHAARLEEELCRPSLR